MTPLHGHAPRRVSLAVAKRRAQMPLALLTVALLTAGCGGHGAQPANAVDPQTGAPIVIGRSTSPHAIHVFSHQSDGTTTQLAFGPAEDALASAGNTAARGKLVPFDQSDAGSSVTMPPTIAQPSRWDTAWTLAWRAALQCDPSVVQTPSFAHSDLPWAKSDAYTSWYYYISAADCSQRLAIEQDLVCVADHLAQIADAVGAVTWPAVPGGQDAGPFDYTGGDAGASSLDEFTEWVIPPQTDSDRFIVRDLAIHTLAMLPTVDAFADITFPAPIDAGTCSQAYAWAASPATQSSLSCTAADTSWTHALFGTGTSVGLPDGGSGPSFPALPPSALPVCDSTAGSFNVPKIAAAAITLEAQTLRAGGRLLHDLIRRDVYSDLAAAARAAAQPTVPNTGAEVAWGVGGPTGQATYGTIAHAGRVLMGRWEIGDNGSPNDPFPVQVQDPQCAGVAERGIVAAGYGPEFDARYLDAPIRTAGEEAAVRLVEASGLVLSSCALPGGANALSTNALRALLAAQLLTNEQALSNVAPVPNDPQAAVFQQAVASLGSDEIAFAFQRVLRTWRLLTDQPDPLCSATNFATAGLAASPLDGGVIGAVVTGGLSRSRLKTDTVARTGGILQLSQCPDGQYTAPGGFVGLTSASGWTPWAVDNGAAMKVPMNPSATIPQPSLPTVVFQDAFHVGQAIERRLVSIQNSAFNLGQLGTDQSTGADPVARGAIAELSSWAGSTLVQAWPTSPSTMQVLVQGMLPSDFGVTGSVVPAGVVQSAFGFVYGPPWVAECAARVRADCPANFAAQYVKQPQPVVDLWNGGQWAGTSSAALKGYGILNSAYLLTVPFPTSPVAGATVPLTGPAGNNALYMVMLNDPKSALGQGRVLGTLPMNGYQPPACFLNVDKITCPQPPPAFVGDVVNFVDAPMQRELLHAALDLGEWIGTKAPALGDPAASMSSGYCVDGVRRNLFVPLDNELISGTATYEDSWQHYLDLAQQAAVTADTLGQQLIANDLQISQNQQAAEEKLADLCGDFGALNTATVGNNGAITAGPADPVTQACLNTPTTDVVFLGSLPPGISATSDSTAAIKQFLGCNADGGPPAAAAVLCNKTQPLTADSLGLITTFDAGSGPSLIDAGNNSLGAACATVLAAIPALTGTYPSGATPPTGLDAFGLMGAFRDPTFASATMSSAIASLSMNVDLFDNWSVAFGGQTIMSSIDAMYWPACAPEAGGPGCGPPAADAGPGVTSLATLRLAYGSAFGGCEAATCSGLAAADLLNIYKLRVSLALWTIGGSAGVIPAGTFTLPVPVIVSAGTAADYATGYWGAVQTSNLTPQQASECNPDAGACAWLTDVTGANSSLVTLADTAALGPLYPVNPNFNLLKGYTGELLPWYTGASAYGADAGALWHAMSSSADVVFTGADGGLTFAQMLGAATGGSLSGLQCPYGIGDVAHPPTVPSINDEPFGWYVSNYLQAIAPAQAAAQTDPSCPLSSYTLEPWYRAQNTGQPLSPLCVSKEQRASFFAGPAFLDQHIATCPATTAILRAAVLSCTAPSVATAKANAELEMGNLPPISSPTDLVDVEAWLALTQNAVQASAMGLYVQNIPTSVISDFKQGTVGASAAQGTKGQSIASIEQAIQAALSAWLQVGSDITQIRDSVRSARLSVELVSIQEQTTMATLRLQATQTMAAATQSIMSDVQSMLNDMASASGVVDNMESLGMTGGLHIAAAGVAGAAMQAEIVTTGVEVAQIDGLKALASSLKQVETAQAIAALATTIQPIATNIQISFNGLRTAASQINQGAAQVALISNQAAYQAAVGTGADFVTVAGQEVPIPVDTVLRRQASATEQRYQTALTNAKALSYMARRAIEQRIGVTLDQFTQNVGPLTAPASWADDICGLQGVNYAKLSSALPAGADGGGVDGSVDQAAISGFANAWVGDYVNELRNFVTYYNVQYPSHQGEDTAVLSLRYDLLGPVAQCTTQGPNLLLNSGDLGAMSPDGWQLAPCGAGAAKCLEVVTGDVLQNLGTLPGTVASVGPVATVTPGSGATWLTEVAVTNRASDAGTDAPSDAAGIILVDATVSIPPATSSWPSNTVGQSVSLQPGAYVLSWWDQGRDLTGALPASQPSVRYGVAIEDDAGNPVASTSVIPYFPQVASDGGAPLTTWSDRHSLSFVVPSAGSYLVSFAASTAPNGALGSVAIANVQLEAAPSGQPGMYVSTTGTTLVSAYNCPRSASDLRSAFTHVCNANGVCWYDLEAPMIIDTSALNEGQSSLDGKLAGANYNYRDSDLAVNLVGTGVHSCANDPSPNCYGSGYIQYDLQHDATNAGIVGFDGNSRIFDFGTASINHGKALAAERYLTMPLSSSDQQLVTQHGVQHVELGGRPLDGSYRLRIWDSPDLNWSALQDIQIVFNYEYWTNIIANGNQATPRPLSRPRVQPVIAPQRGRTLQAHR